MAEPRDLLVEIGTEELPPKALKRLADKFGEELSAGLTAAGLEHGEVAEYGAPRRLAVLVSGLVPARPDRELARRGPALAAAFDADGNATKAALGFARSCGVDVDQLERFENAKGSWLMLRTIEVGQPTTELVPAIVESALAKLPIPKRMRWADLDVEFARPVHWVVLLYGEETIHTEILGVGTGRQTHGHRFHQPHALSIDRPSDYAALLYDTGHVVADFDTRREMIRSQVEETAAQLGGRALIGEALLDEVTALVEWPVAVAGTFDREFLELPSGVLIATMQGHQKYFPVDDGHGRLMPHFIAISNIDSHNPDTVRAGNERVIRPRLNDAAFFYKVDLQKPLAERLEGLKSILFQEKLGSLYDRSERISALAAHIAQAMGGGADAIERARRAGWLCKCDLATDMVGEFPELQGYMGHDYALKTGEPEEVAVALEEAYLPRFAGDAIPSHDAGLALALADKLDILVGIFGIGQVPSGDKDPFALRRAALGVLRILIEGELDLDLPTLLNAAAEGLGDRLTDRYVTEQVFEFMLERLRAYFSDQGIPADVYAAVLARRPSRPHDFARRVQAVEAFRKLPQAASLAAANKRIQNILKQVDGNVPDTVNETLFAEDAERELAARLGGIRHEVTTLLEAADYDAALTELASLRDPVDAFFDKVMVMTDEDAVKNNRLALLQNIGTLFLETADISQLQS